MDHTIKSVDNRLYRGYRIISGKEGVKVNDLLIDAIKLFIDRNTREIKKYPLHEDAIEREIIIKDIPDDLFRRLNKIVDMENQIIDDFIVKALYEYVFDKEVDYRKELLNIEEDEFH